ncbi:MAG: hypothetical protein ACE5IF_05765 [Candidatus Bathyarchaeia archaeon]
MIPLNYRLGDKPLKTVEDATLFQNDRCIVSALKGTLTLPIIIDEETEGYVFHGAGKLLLDAVIETSRGAVGKPINRDLKDPFLMIGGAKETRESLDPADSSDLSKLGYENLEAFSKRANELCRSLFKRKFRRIDLDEKEARVFAFQNVDAKPDVLVSKKDKLVYTSRRNVYVFKGDKDILKRPGEVVVSKKGRTIVVNDRNVVVER